MVMVTSAVAGRLVVGSGITVSDDGSGNLAIYGPTGIKIFTITSLGQVNIGSSKFQVNSNGVPITSNGLTLAGQGFPLIVSAPAATLGNTAAVTNQINYVPPSSAGQVYRLTAYIDVTAWTTPASFTVVATYTNAEGTGKTVTLPVFEDDGSASASALIDEVSGFNCVPLTFTIDNSGTAITLSTTGTFTGSPVYDFITLLERLI